jgi:hypothetical protein
MAMNSTSIKSKLNLSGRRPGCLPGKVLGSKPRKKNVKLIRKDLSISVKYPAWLVYGSYRIELHRESMRK